jgi:hypothetical protein
MFKRKVKTVYVAPGFYKDWSNSSYELESIGHRLDSVRRVLDQLKQQKKPKNHWAVIQWKQAEAVLLRKWKLTIRLKDTGLRQIGKKADGPKVSYDWWEGAEEIHVSLPIFDNISYWINEKFGFTKGDLSASWEKAIELKVQRARQGLA